MRAQNSWCRLKMTYTASKECLPITGLALSLKALLGQVLEMGSGPGLPGGQEEVAGPRAIFNGIFEWGLKLVSVSFTAFLGIPGNSLVARGVGINFLSAGRVLEETSGDSLWCVPLLWLLQQVLGA